MEKKRITLIIVNYRSVHLLVRFFESLRLCPDFSETEVVVVNNDPLEQRALSRLAGRFRFRLELLPENKGFGSACNHGAAVAYGNWLGFLNPDMIYRSGTFQKFLSEASSERDIIGAELLDVSGSLERYSAGFFWTPVRVIARRIPFLGKMILSGTDGELDWVSGGALFLSRPLFEKLGGFDERFFLYYEDIDLCFRAKQNGARVRRSSRLSFFHKRGGSERNDSERKEKYFSSQKLYFKKHIPRWQGRVFDLIRNIRYGW